MVERPKAHHLFLHLALAFVVNPGIVLPVHGQTCTPGGFACINCTAVQMCTVDTPSGPVLTCPAGTICSASAPFECSPGVCFSCTSMGRFPDPSNPGRYFICWPNAGAPGGFDEIEMMCPTDTVFDPTTMRCAFPVTTTTTMDTTTTADTTTTTVMTTTSMTTPTTTTSTTRTTPTTTSSTTTTTTPIPTTTIYPCVQEGRFPDVTNCSNYFLCASDTIGGFYVYKYTCPTTTQFSPTVRKCVLASASGCTPISG